MIDVSGTLGGEEWPRPAAKVYSHSMAFNLWLSAEEERILERIMRHEHTRTKEQAVIKAIRATGERLEAEQRSREIPVGVAASAPGRSAVPG